MNDIYKIKKDEWIILRLMYLILSTDPTMSKTDEIQRTIRHISKKHKYANARLIDRAFDLIKKEHGKTDTFNNVEVHSFRNLSVTIHHNYKDEEERDFMQRRVFGLSRQEPKKQYNVIQDMLSKINLDLDGKHDS
jgi:hypothetical protein